mmetsp:Transcript_15989/g.42141  ORF Transcript_15989/g.42141 Transcript_15989/m.42141 type:complete len:155 (+) Transcript_15989:466-930(+)
MALLGLGNKYSIGIRSNTLSCINAQQVIAGSAKTKRNTWVVHSCLRYESMDPGDLSDIQPASKRKGRGESLLTRQQYGALVGNDLRFLNVLKAMVGDVHQIPSDKDKCCVLMAILHSLWYYFPHRAHEGVIDEIADAVEKAIETIAEAEAAAVL